VVLLLSSLAEAAKGKAVKGTGVRVVGRLRQDEWVGDDGSPCSRVVVAAEHIVYRMPEKTTSTRRRSKVHNG